MPFNDTCPFCKKKFIQTDEITIDSNVIYHEKCLEDQIILAEEREKRYLIDLISEETYNKIEENCPYLPSDLEEWDQIIHYKFIAYFLFTSRNTSWGELKGANSLEELQEEYVKENIDTNHNVDIIFILIDKKYVNFDVETIIKIKEGETE